MQGRKKAAAIKYDSGYDDLQLVATGVGQIAERIIEKASENKVPIVYNKELVNLLSYVDVDDSVPTELYGIVAEILVFIMETDAKMND